MGGRVGLSWCRILSDHNIVRFNKSDELLYHDFFNVKFEVVCWAGLWNVDIRVVCFAMLVKRFAILDILCRYW